MAGGAALVATAAVSGGAVLLYMTPPTAENMRPGDEGPGGRALVPSPSIQLPEHKAVKADDPPPGPPPADSAGEPRAPEGGPAPRKSSVVRPVDPGKTGVKAAAPIATACSVKVVGMPVVLLQGGLHTLQVAKQPKRPLSSEVVDFELTGDRALVVVGGPKYGGHVTVSREDCRPGAPIDLPVRPKPAILDFTGTPKQTTVVCVAGPCPDKIQHLLDVEKFPEIDLGGQLEAEITIEARAQGYASKQFKQRIFPGHNPFPIALTQL
jgi:hypothetical protein